LSPVRRWASWCQHLNTSLLTQQSLRTNVFSYFQKSMSSLPLDPRSLKIDSFIKNTPIPPEEFSSLQLPKAPFPRYALTVPVPVPPPTLLSPSAVSLEEVFAIVQIGGHQYKVVPDDIIIVQKMTAEVGDEIYLHKVLMVGGKDFTAIGKPILTRAKIKAQVQENTRTEKMIVYKKKRRKTYQRTKGIHQPITVLWIQEILMDFENHLESTDE